MDYELLSKENFQLGIENTVCLNPTLFGRPGTVIPEGVSHTQTTATKKWKSSKNFLCSSDSLLWIALLEKESLKDVRAEPPARRCGFR